MGEGIELLTDKIHISVFTMLPILSWVSQYLCVLPQASAPGVTALLEKVKFHLEQNSKFLVFVTTD